MKRTGLINRFLKNYYRNAVVPGSSILELGCGTEELLHAMQPAIGIGIDFSKEKIEKAKQKYPHLSFQYAHEENISLNGKFDYVILSHLSGLSVDIQNVFKTLKKYVHRRTRIIISSYNHLWQPAFEMMEKFGFRKSSSKYNWLSIQDMEGLLGLESFELVKIDRKLLFPWYFPFVHFGLNKFLANLPGIRRLNLIQFTVARYMAHKNSEYSVSIVILARNEKGNIENAILQTPVFGSHQEFIFIEGGSSDGTYQEMLRILDKYSDKDIKILKQTGRGKGNAVREAFDKASGDILMILDAAKLNLKIVEVIVRYRGRHYGSTQINRFKDRFLLLKMSYKAAFKNQI